MVRATAPSPRRARPDAAVRAPSWTLAKVSLRLALILMTLSLFAPVEVDSPAGMERVAFGLPVPFVVQDARRYASGAYPRRVRLADPRQDPTRLRPLAALADLVLLTLGLMAAARALGVDRAAGRAGGREGGRGSGRPQSRR